MLFQKMEMTKNGHDRVKPSCWMRKPILCRDGPRSMTQLGQETDGQNIKCKTSSHGQTINGHGHSICPVKLINKPDRGESNTDAYLILFEVYMRFTLPPDPSTENTKSLRSKCRKHQHYRLRKSATTLTTETNTLLYCLNTCGLTPAKCLQCVWGRVCCLNILALWPSQSVPWCTEIPKERELGCQTFSFLKSNHWLAICWPFNPEDLKHSYLSVALWV